MPKSSVLVEKAQRLAASGRHAEVVQYLEAQQRSELEESASLALLYGTAQARLGRHEEGQRWLDTALALARSKDDQSVERRAVNASGALALASGRVDEAAEFFTQGLMAASRDGDFATTGRCSNNLGIVSNLRGRHAEAIGSWEIAVAAFDRAGLRQGVVECRHNLGISYREQGALDKALAEADLAVADAAAARDDNLCAIALRGRAEIRVVRGDLDLARRELDQVRDLRSGLADPAGEAEDLRVMAALLRADRQLGPAETALRSVILRAEAQQRPHLVAEATRDLAILLHQTGRTGEAQIAARAAKVIFSQLGAKGEIRNLARHEWDDDFAAELRRSLEPLHEAQQLADAGRYSELLSYLGEHDRSDLEQSPMLALLCGIGQARLGRLVAGWEWAMTALSRARALGDRILEVRALNICGAIALERGGINEATHFFMEAQAEAMKNQDMATVARCANNLGIISNMQGDYGRAVGAYTRALGAYQTAGYDRGIAESQHNLAISYREQGRLEDAMQAADAAVREAVRLGDTQLKAQALAGRAEIWTAKGEPALALQQVTQALAIHRGLKDAVRETEDLRIMGVALGASGEAPEAQWMLRDVILRAGEHDRPLLVASAQRDLAHLLAREGQFAEARKLALEARATFHRLGAKVEIDKLDVLLRDPDLLDD